MQNRVNVRVSFFPTYLKGKYIEKELRDLSTFYAYFDLMYQFRIFDYFDLTYNLVVCTSLI